MIEGRNTDGTFAKGSKGVRTGVPVSEETRLKMRLAKLGKKQTISEESRKKFLLRIKGNKYNLGRKWSAEVIQKRIDKTSGELHYLWKGDDVSYSVLHKWIKKVLGKPDTCCRCGTKESKRFHWHNKNMEYKRNLNDWEPICCRCHAHEHKNWEKRWQKSA